MGGGVEGQAFGETPGGDATKFTNEPEPREKTEGVEGDVDFPPIETLASAGHVVVVIVVPAFAKGDESEKPIVFAGVGGGKTALAENVRKRIDGEGAMPEKNGTQAETPSEEPPAAEEVHSEAKNGRGNDVVFVEPAKLGKFGEVADVVETRVVVLVRKNPANVGPPETEERGGVEIFLLVGKAMVVAMMS